jgi:hypothetical protein
MPPVFLSESVIAITIKSTWMIHTSFAVVRLLFHKDYHFNTLCQHWVRCCISVLKNSVPRLQSTLQKFSFSLLSSAKRACMYYILYRAKQMIVGECQIWAVSRMGKNNRFCFCDCLKCVQVGVRLGNIMKEKDIFYVLVRINSTDTLSQFV